MKKFLVILSILGVSLGFSTLAYSYESEININGGFERDQNGNSLPDFWETVWRNGTSAGSFASIQSFDPVEGSNHFRLYSGIGDSQSYVYALSDPIKIVKGVAYKINTSMRYTLPTGDARITIIEIDNSGKNINETQRAFSNGGWKWHNHDVSIFPRNETKYIRIRLEVGGEEGAYLDIDNVFLNPIDINGDYENDFNKNGLPDFWETTWRNGISKEAIASKQGFEPIDGNSQLRLYNGLGDSNSYIYALSDRIPVSYGSSYDISAFMKYTLSTGHAEITIIEVDDNDNTITESSRSLNDGGWKWHYHSILITPKWQTKYIRIRFAVGGEEKAYLDIDHVAINPVTVLEKWKSDIPNQTRYFYDSNGRLSYILLPDGHIIMHNYNNNGALLKRVVL
ncbi:hypothetical protein D3C76_147960 [compost metagenome]